MITIEVVNKSTVTLPQPLLDILEAIEQQISADFAPAWALEPALFTAVDEFTKGTGNYRMLIADDSTQADALGFHDYVDAEPIAYCFAKTTIDSGSLFSVTVCHESLEMLADPEICFASVFGTEILGLEVGDPVEDDALGYQVNGIQMSDFVFILPIILSQVILTALWQKEHQSRYTARAREKPRSVWALSMRARSHG